MRSFLVSYSYSKKQKGLGSATLFGVGNGQVSVDGPLTLDTVRNIEKGFRERTGYDELAIIAFTLLEG